MVDMGFAGLGREEMGSGVWNPGREAVDLPTATTGVGVGLSREGLRCFPVEAQSLLGLRARAKGEVEGWEEEAREGRDLVVVV